MAACNLQREVNGSTALYRITGKFEASCAGDLSERLHREPLYEVVVDFSQVNEFVDSGVAVIASSLASAGHSVRLRGLRQHQERLFRYFGVDLAELPLSLPPHVAGTTAKEVA